MCLVFLPAIAYLICFFNLYRWNKKYDADMQHFTNQICVSLPYSKFTAIVKE